MMKQEQKTNEIKNQEKYEDLAMKFFLLFDELGEQGRKDFFEEQCPDLMSKIQFLKACYDVYNIDGVEHIISSVKNVDSSIEEGLETANKFLAEIRSFIETSLAETENTHENLVRSFSEQKTYSEIPEIHGLEEYIEGNIKTQPKGKSDRKLRPEKGSRIVNETIKRNRLNLPYQRG